MLTLVFTVCMLGDPAACETREIPVFERMSPVACVMQAPATLAEWRETHPDWRVTRWSCQSEQGAPMLKAKAG